MKSILDICQEVADMAATKRPANLFDRNSQQDSIFLSVAKSALDSLLRYGDWQELTKEGVLQTAGGRKQYLLDECAPDFYSLLNNTVYIKDCHEKVIGAINPEDWMKEKYLHDVSTDTKFNIQNGMIKFLSPPADGLKIVFQYRSNIICYDPKQGYMEKSCISKDTDIPIFDEYLVKLGILWRWLKRNGMDYMEEYSEYERELKKRYGSSLATKDINLAGGIFNEDTSGGVYINAKTD